ncbi:MAG: hypothetical protein VXZ15_15455 [Planctomycetota bacterium]|nr:hypothetical protein [Planctomycetota bacterium]
MRRWFVLTLVGGVFLTLSGCGGEVATETADSGGAAQPTTPTPAATNSGASGADPMAAQMGGGPSGGGPSSGSGGQSGGRRPVQLPGDPFAATMGDGGEESGGGGDSGNPMGSGYDPENPMGGGYPGQNPYDGGAGAQNPYAQGGNPANPMGGGYPGQNPYGGGAGTQNPYAQGGNPANPMGGGYPGQNPYGSGGPPPAGNGGSGAGEGAVDITVPGAAFGGGRPTGPPTGPPAPTGQPGYGNPGAARQPVAPKTLKEKAMAAFREGKDDEATQYMYAYMVADPGAEFDFGLLPSINEPRAVVRWGIAVDYSAPGNFTKAPPTIGAQPNVMPQIGGNRGGGRGGFGGGAPSVGEPSAGGGPGSFGGGAAQGPPSGGQAQLNYYTGELGKKIVERLNMRRLEGGGFYGQFLKDVAFQYNPEAGGGGGGGYGGYSPMGGAGFDPSGAGVGSGGGAGFDPMGAGVGSGGGGGDYGAPGSGNPYGGQGGNPSAQRSANTDQLIPGVVWLGRGRRTEMLETARARGLDGLILIETKISVIPKNGLESNITKVYVMNVHATEAKEQMKYQTRSSLKNVPVWQAIQQEKQNPIETELDRIFPEVADIEFKLGALPSLQPDQAKARVSKVATSTPVNLLPVLAEVKYFHKVDLINDADLMSAYENLLGDAEAAKTLASGQAEEREQAINAWLPGNWSPPSSKTGGGRFR